MNRYFLVAAALALLSTPAVSQAGLAEMDEACVMVTSHSQAKALPRDRAEWERNVRLCSQNRDRGRPDMQVHA
jgi:hypothetical protein